MSKKVKIDEQRYCELLNKERLLASTVAVQHRHCEEYKADAEKWRNRVPATDEVRVARDEYDEMRAICAAVGPQDLADAALGRLVRRMPLKSNLQRQASGWYFYLGKKELRRNYDTPEEALIAALDEENPK